MIADALSRMNMCSVSLIDETKKDLVKEVHRFLDWALDWKILRMVVF